MSTDLCKVPDCGQAACVSVADSSFCRFHFVAYAYGRLEECGEQIAKREYIDDLVLKRLLETLTAIAVGAVTVALEGTNPNPMERAQILDILATVTSLAQPLGPATQGLASLHQAPNAEDE